MPTVTFNTIGELVTYIDQFIKVNHNNEITGDQHNNVEIGLTDFIIKSPRNYNRANVTATAAAFIAVASQCVLIFKAGATGSIQLIDNKWNEWVIYNNSGASKTLVGSISTYVTGTGITRNYIPNGQCVSLAKGNDNKWYEVANNTGSSTGSVSFIPLSFEIGQVGSPMVAGETVLVITVDDAIPDGEWISLDNNYIQPDVTGQISYTAVYTGTNITITFNQAVFDTQKYFIKYATR